ncbi:calcium/sodium antiporter [Biformimicrobium ophioploci]|uniref:Calcium/sodium antiporter n=1 Tax=Biformimicrobium ophioploci TaxID=3036711 RepID=A0ABQ6LWZ2_9GAMM|nr:calcium/sodium antiporter [Microbulbifer sp. NKW57]GMG86605.1 calcium/sodium antiporter [Microbulbifer sp. NKW57]
MSEVWLAALAILVGFGGLVWSADRFVAGSAALAYNFGLSKLVIGLTIVSLGTSAPEVMVAISASLKGAGELAVGNAIGSNLANIGLVLAATALISPLPVQKHLLKQEIPVLLVITLLAGFVLYDAKLTFVEGLVLAGLLVPLLWVTVKFKKGHPDDELEDAEIPDYTVPRAIAWFFVGLAALLVSSEILVWGARSIAEAAGVSPLIIGLTVIAVGTSLPELAASIASALKGHHDMALGNIIGSNIFNILAVMSVPGLIATTTMDTAVFNRDYLAMLGITAALALAILIRFMQGHERATIGRWIGIFLLLCYIAYYWTLF